MNKGVNKLYEIGRIYLGLAADKGGMPCAVNEAAACDSPFVQKDGNTLKACLVYTVDKTLTLLQMIFDAVGLGSVIHRSSARSVVMKGDKIETKIFFLYKIEPAL